MDMTRTRTLAVIGALGIAALALSGCSASPSDSAAAEPARQSDDASAQPQPRGISGEIAVVSDGLLQVQDSDSQTAVSYTADTGITREVAAQLSDVVVGACITGFGGGDDSSGALTGVAITEPVDGECPAGLGGRGGTGGGMPEGFEPPADGEMPDGPPGGGGLPDGAEPPAAGRMPEGGPGGGLGGVSSGRVTAVDGTTIAIEAVSMDGEANSQDVLVDDATAFTRTETATSDALVAGACVVATGEYAGEQYAATSLAVSEPGDDGCSAVRGGFPGRGAGDD